MADKKKRQFAKLALFFTLVTVLGLYSSWSRAGGLNTSDMSGDTMGEMMKMMHAGGISVPELFAQEEQMTMSQGADSHSSHHSGSLRTVHYITTAAIIILLPLIIAGTVFLAVVWFK